MPITVSGPDGAEIEFPDDTPAETIKSVMAKHYGGPSEPAPQARTAPVKASQQALADASPEVLKRDFDKALKSGDVESAKAISQAVRKRVNVAGPAFQSDRAVLDTGSLAKGVERIAGTIGNVFGGDYQDPVRGQEVADLGEGFVRSTTAPLGGDYVAAGGSFVAGKGYNPDAQRARREELAAKAPLTAAAGEMLGAGGVGKVLAPGVRGLAAQGAATGAITGANLSGGDPVETAKGAALGAVGGKVVEKIGEAFDPMKALASRVKGADGKPIKPQELYQTFKEVEAATGQKPSMVDLLNAHGQKTLARVASTQPAAAKVFNEAQDAASAARPQELPDQIAMGGSRTGSAEMVAQRDDAFTAAMNPIRDKPGLVNPREAMLLLHPDVVNRLDDAAAQKLMAAVQNNKPAFLTVGDLDTVRRTLGQAVKTAQRDGANFGPLTRARATARLIGERIAPEYKAALADYEGRSMTAAGAAMGEKIRSASPGDVMDASVRLSPQGKVGVATGTRKAMTELAGSSEGDAVRAGRELAEPGMQQKLTATLGPGEAARLKTVGQNATRSAENYEAITKKAADEAIDPTDVKKIAGLAATAVAKTKSPGLIVQGGDAVIKGLQRLGMGPGVAKKLAELAVKPGGAEELTDYLIRAQVSPKAIERIGQIVGIQLGTE